MTMDVIIKLVDRVASNLPTGSEKYELELVSEYLNAYVAGNIGDKKSWHSNVQSILDRVFRTLPMNSIGHDELDFAKWELHSIIQGKSKCAY